MAAASLSGRGSTKGLFCFLTLLVLVGLTSSLMNGEQLEKLKRELKKMQQNLDMEKATRHATSEVMDYYVKVMDPLIALVKEVSKDLPDDFPPLEGLMNTVKNFVEKTKTFVDGLNAEVDEDIESAEQELRRMEAMINAEL